MEMLLCSVNVNGMVVDASVMGFSWEIGIWHDPNRMAIEQSLHRNVIMVNF